MALCYPITEKVINLEFYYWVTVKSCGRDQSMNVEGHLRKSEELWHAIDKLTSEPEEDVVAIVELAIGMCHHLIAYGMERRFGHHIDTHAGVSGLLRENGAHDIANAFEQIGSLRQGRFYGGKGDGPTVMKALELVGIIKGWARE